MVPSRRERYQSLVLSLKPTAYYRFGADASPLVGTVTGTPNGTVTFGVDGALAKSNDGAVDLDDASVIVNGCHSSDPTILVVSLWLHRRTGIDTDVAYGHRDGNSNALFQITSPNDSLVRLQLRSTTSSLISLDHTITLTDGYHFLVGVLNRSTNVHKLYVDGIVRGASITTFGGSFNAVNQTIGGTDTGPSIVATTDGLIDEVAIWDGVEPTAVDIRSMYEIGING